MDFYTEFLFIYKNWVKKFMLVSDFLQITKKNAWKISGCNQGQFDVNLISIRSTYAFGKKTSWKFNLECKWLFLPLFKKKYLCIWQKTSWKFNLDANDYSCHFSIRSTYAFGKKHFESLIWDTMLFLAIFLLVRMYLR